MSAAQKSDPSLSFIYELVERKENPPQTGK